MAGFLAWLQAQASAIGGTLGAVASNSPQPARNVVVHLFLFAVTVFVVGAVVKKFGK